jgi:hypothetical protein
MFYETGEAQWSSGAEMAASPRPAGASAQQKGWQQTVGLEGAEEERGEDDVVRAAANSC